MKKSLMRLIVLFICGFQSIFSDPKFDVNKFQKDVAENTLSTFMYEGIKVTVLGDAYWIKEPIGAFTLMGFGVFIDRNLQQRFDNGEINAKFVIVHEIAHRRLGHNIAMTAVGDEAEKYNQNEIAADYDAMKQMGMSFKEYEAARKWIDHVYFREFITKYGNYNDFQIEWVMREIRVKTDEQIAGVARMLK